MVLNNANNLDEEILRKVDEIIVMSEGKIVGRGDCDSVIKTVIIA